MPGKLQRDPTTGKLKRDPPSGKLPRSTGSTTACCCTLPTCPMVPEGIWTPDFAETPIPDPLWYTVFFHDVNWFRLNTCNLCTDMGASGGFTDIITGPYLGKDTSGNNLYQTANLDRVWLSNIVQSPAVASDTWANGSWTPGFTEFNRDWYKQYHVHFPDTDCNTNAPYDTYNYSILLTALFNSTPVGDPRVGWFNLAIFALPTVLPAAYNVHMASFDGVSSTITGGPSDYPIRIDNRITTAQDYVEFCRNFDDLSYTTSGNGDTMLDSAGGGSPSSWQITGWGGYANIYPCKLFTEPEAGV